MGKGADKENAIYDFIRARLEAGECPPTVREICAAVGLSSPSSVFTYMRSLERQGRISMGKGQKRAVTIPELSRSSAGFVPIIGEVAAGSPLLAFEEAVGELPFDAELCRRKELFALKVRGDSMVNAAILDGDFVVAEKTPVCRNGEIVVALVEDEATVKRFYKENGHFRLQPENDAYEPIIVDNVSILGKVTAVIRYF